MPRLGRPQGQINDIAHRHRQSWAVGDGAATEFPLPYSVKRIDDLTVTVNGAAMRPADRGGARDYRIRGLHANTPIASGAYPGDSNRVRFTAAPGAGVKICFATAGG